MRSENQAISLLPASRFDTMSQKPRIAVVGGGVSGIACLWELRNSPYEVHLFESDDRLGGHANTVTFAGNDKTATVDTGFIVFNKDCYRKQSIASEHHPIARADRESEIREISGVPESTIDPDRYVLRCIRRRRAVRMGQHLFDEFHRSLAKPFFAMVLETSF